MHAQVELADGTLGWVPHPFVWLPVCAYGMSSGLHDLMEGETVAGYALDMSDGGWIVGGIGQEFDADPLTLNGPRAAAWVPASGGGMTRLALDPAGSDWEWSIATAVEPAPDALEVPRIVGTGLVVRCGAGVVAPENEVPMQEPIRFVPAGDGWVAEGFRTTEPANDDLLDNIDVSAREWACDIAGAQLPVLLSFAHPALANPDCTYGAASVHCRMEMIAGAAIEFWSDMVSSWFRISEGGSREPTMVRSQSPVRGSEGECRVAGWVNLGGTGSQPPCPIHPAYWHGDDTRTARILERQAYPGAAVAGDSELAWVAQRWRAADCVCDGEVIVGWGARLDAGIEGVIWTATDPANGDDFQGFDVEAALLPGLDPTGVITVERVYDVLPTGELLCIVRRDTGVSGSPAGCYAALLAMSGDFDGDRSVTGFDLALLFDDRGELGQSPEDINWNGVVDGGDLSALVVAFGNGITRLSIPSGQDGSQSICFGLPGEPCTAAGITEPPDGGDSVARFTIAVQQAGFDCADGFVNWARQASADQLECGCCMIAGIMKVLGEEANNDH